MAAVAVGVLAVGGGAFLLGSGSTSDEPDYSSAQYEEPVAEDPVETEDFTNDTTDVAPYEEEPPVEEEPSPDLPISVTVRDTNGVQLRLRNEAGLWDESNKKTIKGGADEGDVLYVECVTDGFTYYPSNSSSSSSTWARLDDGKYVAAWYLVTDDGSRVESLDYQTLPRC